MTLLPRADQIMALCSVVVMMMISGVICDDEERPTDDDDVGLHVLGCRVDILRTNCKKLLKVKMSGEGWVGWRESLWLQYV